MRARPAVLGIGWAALWLAPSALATPALGDYAAGLAITAQATRPIQEFVLPDAVYAGVTRADLADLRIFNRAGVSVPHVFCPGPEQLASERGERALPVFAINRKSGEASGAGHIDVKTAAGTQLRILEPVDAPERSQPAAWIIDAGGVDETIEALDLSWQGSGENVEFSVQIKASADLDQWLSLVQRSTMVLGAGEGSVLERSRIPLPPGSYRYLRIESTQNDALPRLLGARAYWVRRAPEPQLRQFSARLLAPEPDQLGIIYDAGRLAPVQRAWPRLPQDNMLLRIALDSRASAQDSWQQRWTGEAYALRLPDGQQRFALARFEPVTQRWWRIRVLRGRDTLGGAWPELDLAYHPAKLRFLAQGEGPFTLAFGSARALPAQLAPCGSLLAAAGPGVGAGLIGVAGVDGEALPGMGGMQALQPRPQAVPLRRIALWAVLIASCLLLVAMAAKLLRMIRPQ